MFSMVPVASSTRMPMARARPPRVMRLTDSPEIQRAKRAEAMEMGADAVLVNTAIAAAGDPVRIARAFRDAVRAGREAWEAGLPMVGDAASATSPLTGFLGG